MAILKTARQLGLYQDLACVSVPGEGSLEIPEELLQRAVARSTESLQVDALQLACVHPKATSLPGDLPSEQHFQSQCAVLGKTRGGFHLLEQHIWAAFAERRSHCDA